MSRVLVTGAGGFIGSWLVKRLRAEGHMVRGVDLKEPEWERSEATEFLTDDLRDPRACAAAVVGIDDVYQLAADMGGIGYITQHHAEIARNNTLINAHMLEASRRSDVRRYLFTSSACVYPAHMQGDAHPAYMGLVESDAIPADPERGYGWEKLYAEQLTDYYRQDFGLDTRIVRFHNVYGAFGTYDGGKEKAPAAICRKVAATEDGVVDVWGDGKQTRSFMYVDDCVEGLIRWMERGDHDPVNLGTEEMVSVDELVRTVAEVAGKNVEIRHVDGPQGVRGRNSDNARLRWVLGWEPSIRLRDGLARTYPWIAEQVNGGAR